LRISASRRRSYSLRMSSASVAVGSLGMPVLLGIKASNSINWTAQAAVQRESRLSYRRRFRRPFEVALLIRTCDYWASFQHFLHQILATATRARFGYRLTGGGELALGIICAAVECVSFARLLFNQVAFLTERALHSN